MMDGSTGWIFIARNASFAGVERIDPSSPWSKTEGERG
jgi:hypothetical protein